jgi:purine-binding chemotaxis protein CheW
MSEKNQYLLFLTGGVLYAVEALRVKEIVEYSAITKIPMMNKYIKGVTNIRGDIVPVVDLLNRFKLGDTSITDKTSVVVINYKKDDTNTINIGMIIDEIYEVDEINIQDIKLQSLYHLRYIRCISILNLSPRCNSRSHF